MMGIAGREGSHLDRFVRHPSPKTAMGYPLSRLPCFRYSGRSLNLLTAPPNKRTIRCVSPLRRAVFAKSTPAEARPRFRGLYFVFDTRFWCAAQNSQDGIVKLR